MEALRYTGFQGQSPVPWPMSPGHVSPEQGLLCRCGWSLRIHGWPSRDSPRAWADRTLPSTHSTWAATGPLGPADRRETLMAPQSVWVRAAKCGPGLGSPTLQASVPRVVLPELSHTCLSAGLSHTCLLDTVFSHESLSSHIRSFIFFPFVIEPAAQRVYY